MMKELQTANFALGDSDALARIWRERGYWYFRDVLDKDAVGALRARYVAELVRRGVVDGDTSEPVWNRASLGDMGDGLNNTKVPALREARAWETFVAHPRIDAFIGSLIGGAPEWLTASDFYRIVPPVTERPKDPYAGRHQDGHGLRGLDFITCWIPLASIPADCGGLALAEDSFKKGLFYERWYEPGIVPDESWSRADYALGDILMFAPTMMHSGLPNHSDRFRLSLDIRVLRPTSPRPVYGTIVSIDGDHVVVRDAKGADVALTIADDSHLRGMTSASDIPIAVGRQEVAR